MDSQELLTTSVISALAVLHWTGSLAEARRAAQAFLCKLPGLHSPSAALTLARHLTLSECPVECLVLQQIPEADASVVRVVEAAARHFGLALIEKLISRNVPEERQLGLVEKSVETELSSFFLKLLDNFESFLGVPGAACERVERQKVAQVLARFVLSHWNTFGEALLVERLIHGPVESTEYAEFVCLTVSEILNDVLGCDESVDGNADFVDQTTTDRLSEVLIENAEQLLSLPLRLLEAPARSARTESSHRISLQLLVMVSKCFPETLLLEALVPVRLAHFMTQRVHSLLTDWSLACAESDWLVIEALGNLQGRFVRSESLANDELIPLLEIIISTILHFDETLCAEIDRVSFHQINWEERFSLLLSLVDLGLLALETMRPPSTKEATYLPLAVTLMLRLQSHPSPEIAERTLSVGSHLSFVRNPSREEAPFYLESLRMQYFGTLMLPKLCDLFEATSYEPTSLRRELCLKLVKTFARQHTENRKLCVDLKSRVRDHLRRLCRQWPDICMNWALERSEDRLRRLQSHTDIQNPSMLPLWLDNNAYGHRIWRSLLLENSDHTVDAAFLISIHNTIDEALGEILLIISDQFLRLLREDTRNRKMPAPAETEECTVSEATQALRTDLQSARANCQQFGKSVWNLFKNLQNLNLNQNIMFFDALLHFFRGCLPVLIGLCGIKSDFIPVVLLMLRRLQSLNSHDESCRLTQNLNRIERWSLVLCNGVFFQLSQSDAQEVAEHAHYLLPLIQEAQETSVLPFRARCQLFKCIPVILRFAAAPIDRLGILESTLREPISLWRAMAEDYAVLCNPDRFISAFLGGDDNAKCNRACLLQLVVLFEQMLGIEMEAQLWASTSLCRDLLSATLPGLVGTLNRLYSKQQVLLPPSVRSFVSEDDNEPWLGENADVMDGRDQNIPVSVKPARLRGDMADLRLWLWRVSSRSHVLFQRVLALGATRNFLVSCFRDCFAEIQHVETHYLSNFARHVIAPLLLHVLFEDESSDFACETVSTIWLPLLHTIQQLLEDVAQQISLEEGKHANHTRHTGTGVDEDPVWSNIIPNFASFMTEFAISLLQKDVKRRSIPLFLWSREFLRMCLVWFYMPSARKACFYIQKHLINWTQNVDVLEVNDASALLVLIQTLVRAVDDERWLDLRNEVRKTLAAATIELRRISPELDIVKHVTVHQSNVATTKHTVGGGHAVATLELDQTTGRKVSLSTGAPAKTDVIEASVELNRRKPVPMQVLLKQSWRKLTRYHLMELEEEEEAEHTTAALESISVLFG
jgi:hypothetical protein